MRTSRARRAVPAPRLAWLVLLPALSGCWFTSNRAATAEYDRRVMIASMRVAQLEESLADAESRLTQAEEWIRDRGQQESEQLENIEQVDAAVRDLRGDIEILQFSLQEVLDGLEGGQVDRERRFLHAERRLEQVEKFLGVRPPPPPTDEELGLVDVGEGTEDEPVDGQEGAEDATEDGADTTEAAEEPTPQDAEGMLELGITHMKEGRQGVARALFEKAIEQFAGDPLVAELRYRVAETWYNEAKWQKAAMAFQHVIDNDGTSTWAPWAMYRQGECFGNMGDPSSAGLFYEELIRIYPRSDAAKDAKRALQDL